MKSDGTNERPIWKRKFIDFNNICSGETAHFSPSKRQKIQNCPNITEIFDRLASYPVKGIKEDAGDADCGQKGDFRPAEIKV